MTQLDSATRGTGAAPPRPGTSPAAVKRVRLFGPVHWTKFWICGGAALALLLGTWWTLVALQLVNPFFLPAPASVWSGGIEMWRSGQLTTDTLASVQRITVGFLISTAIALPIGLFMGTIAWVEASLEPIIDFIRYMPAVAFVPLTIVWFGVGEGQKYSIIFIGTFFQQVLMVMDNVKRTPREYLQVGETLGLSSTKLLQRIVLPASAPAIWDTIRITLGGAWTWLVVAELVAAPDGLGQRIMVSQRYFDTDRIFFLIMLIGVIGLVLDQFLKFIGKRLFPWASAEGV